MTAEPANFMGQMTVESGKFTSRSEARRAVTALVLTAALLSAAVAQAATPTQAASAGARLAKMAPGSTSSCTVGKSGNLDCLVDTVRTRVSECAGDYAWGQVSEKDGVTLESAFDKAKAKPTVHLASRQFVCVAATAGNNQIPDRFYVIAFPLKRVPGCKENDLCQERQQTWVGTKPEGPCQWVGKEGDFTGACAAGWVSPDSIEVFSMGLQ
ncbi:hypothetical protein FIV34_06710 [Luteibacter pinisoli]|uniref:Uncharacterized protein n=1 Tax=Luteibacter pinisoli TaxID=2589080 RepID=A0A4Y5Z0V8_9GAMM|nr:hypothetical protein [Luteibacter pinisoli]QDE38912.1 hypothetical protein FIV34_06710 [Luteibacter pinisoli]